MKFKNLSVKHLFSWIMAGQAVSIIVITLTIFIFTKQTAVLLAGILLLLCTLIWFVVYTQILAKRLVSFTSDLCRTIDSMISGNEEPILLEEQETQFARISHRLSRLYQIMQENRRRVDKERREVQTLVSDISHQVKTPVSNLKMATDTLLEKPMPEAERTDFIWGIRNQTDKLDFLFQALTYAILPAEFSTSNDVADETLLMGYNEKDMDSLTTAIVSGNITENTELIVSDPDRVYDVYHWKPQIGNTVTFNFKNNSGKTITKTFKIGAITSSNDGMGGYIFRMPEKMMHELVGYDCTYAIEVQTEPESIQEAENKIRSLIAGNDEVSLQTLQDFTKEHQEDNQAGFTLAYIISAILWVFAVINQINLTVTNLLSQKQEMGTLKSIGMTNKQLEQSFMIEGLFNTGISLFMTIIIGIPGGYMIGTFLEKAGMSTGFVFPTRAFLLFVTVMLLLEVLMTILLIHSWKKQSVIEIMRN